MATKLINLTSYPAMRFSNTDNQGREFGVLMSKIAFDIEESGACTLSAEQEPLNFTDHCHGEFNVSSLRHPSDMVSYKPTTDIIVDAVAYSPRGEAVGSWVAGLSVRDDQGRQIEKKIRVTGPRWWIPKWKRALSEHEQSDWHRYRHLFQGWELSDPEPITSLPIRYEHAFGGMRQNGPASDGNLPMELEHRNPIGCGWLHPEWTDHTRRHRAPQIEALDEPVNEPYKQYTPVGLGPIPPAWLPRRSLGGTFDKQWQENVWPKWPADYDFAYNNSAAVGLIADSYLEGELLVELFNLRPNAERLTLNIPNSSPLVAMISEDDTEQYLFPPIDTVFLELAGVDLFDCRVSLTARTPFDRATIEVLSLCVPDEEDRQKLVKLRDKFDRPKHPTECANACDLLEREGLV